ncbi:sorting nexin-6 [Megalops cyprinoides]|uniref:sorting nexin-6 n=1 Tax=Megalops cyprinoides TaxID=118141 RepID=UPI001863FD0C|nr:sorting nexin-6 [Megalops cyprinoides]
MNQAVCKVVLELTGSRWFQEEVTEVARPGLDISVSSIRVTEAVKNGDSLVFVVKSEELSSSQGHHVERTFEDFEWLQHCLYTQEEVPGLQGIIFPPLPAKPVTSQSNSQAKVLKQLGFLAMGEDWKTYCKAMQKYLQLVAAHSMLSKNKALLAFLTDREPPERQRVRKGLFNRLSQAVEEKRKENHKDIDDFFQNERDDNLTITGFTRAATEKFLDMVLTEQKIAVACGHFSASLNLGVGQEEDPALVAFSKICLKLSEIFDTVKTNVERIAENDMNTLGLALDLDLRYQEAEKEMLFQRTCKLVELENANKNVEKAKPVKKTTMEEIKKAVEKEFDHISAVAKTEIERFHAMRVEAFQQSLTEWCESQLTTTKESAALLAQHLAAFRQLAAE